MNIEKVGITGTVSGTGHIGSYIGNQYGSSVTFKNCYARTNIKNSGNYDTGGFVGYRQSDVTIIVDNGYWAGTTNTTGRTGTFSGGYSIKNNNNQITTGMEVTNSFYNKDLFTLSVPKVSSGIGLTTERFADSSNFTGWDFTNDWYIDEETGYPELKFDNN